MSKSHPQDIHGYESVRGTLYTFAKCKCGKKWRKPANKKPRIIPLSGNHPFMCPKCGSKVADNTIYF